MKTRIPLSVPDLGPRERALVLETLDAGYVSSVGPMVEQFERAFARYAGFGHAVALTSGTAALHLGLILAGVGPGDAVIVPSLTFIGGVSSIVHLGASPILVDSEPETWGLDSALLDEAFDRAAAQGLTVRAIVPADLYGQCCDIAAIRAVADARGVPVLLDSAEAVGATLDGRHAGHGAAMAAFSFNGNKIITTGGGGMLVSDDGGLIARARYLSTAARQPAVHYEHTEVGFNYRLVSLSAALGLAQLETLDLKVARRRAIFDRYRAQLGHLPGVSFAPEARGYRHSRWLSVLLLDPTHAPAPETVRLVLEAENIETRPIWKPMHRQPVFAAAMTVGGSVADRLFEIGLCLPSSSGLADADLDRVCAVLERVLA